MNTRQRTTLVTGGTDGIGRAVALGLADAGDRVLVVGRDRDRGQQLLADLHERAPGREHAFLPADLASLADTSRLADAIATTTPRLDALVCCAGVLALTPEWTDEGLERSFVLNYLGRFLLARRLLPMLTESASGRIVLVANAGVYPDTLDLDDLQHRRGKRGLAVSGRTQFANDLLATELADRLRDTAVEVSCVFPGRVKTAVFRNARGVPWILRMLALAIQRVSAMTPEAAAKTPLFLAHSPDAVGTSGRFWGPHLVERRVPERALRTDRRAALWHASEALVAPWLRAATSLPSADTRSLPPRSAPM